MTELSFLQPFAVVLVAAAVTTVVFQRFRLPVISGYLLAGLLIGPHLFVNPPIEDVQVVQTLAEIGVVLLLFSVGLEFSLTRLIRVGPASLMIALVQVGLMLWLGFLTGRAFGFRTLEAVFLGAILSISSTTVIVKAFGDTPKAGTFRELVTGVLIVQDVVAILLLAVLTALGSGMRLGLAELGNIGFRLAAFLVALVVIGLLVVPRTFRAIARLGRNETLLIASIGFCFAIALLADEAGYSVALGAFLAGMLVSESGEGERVSSLVAPVRDVFAAVFFVAVGMLVDPRILGENALAVVAVTAVIVGGMTLGASAGALLAGAGTRTAVQTGMSLAQIGEFSIIIAGLGVALGAVRESLHSLTIAVVAITAFTTPWMIRSSGRVSELVDERMPKALQTFLTLYGAWLEQIRSRPRRAGWPRIRRAAYLLVVDAAIVVAIVVALASWSRKGSEWISDRTNLDDRFIRLLLGAGAVALAVPFLVGIVRCARTIGGTLAIEALPDAHSGLDLAAAPRRALVVALQLAILVAVGIPMLAVTQPFLPSGRGAAVFGLVLVGFGVAFWRSATNLEGHVRAGSQMIVEVLAKQRRVPAGGDVPGSPSDASDDPIARIQAVLPGFASLIQVPLPEGAPAVGRTLAELNLRNLTGATVLAVVRGGESIVNPGPMERLLAGDVLAIIGTQQAERAAQALLLGD